MSRIVTQKYNSPIIVKGHGLLECYKNDEVFVF